MENSDFAKILYNIAELLELKNDNPFKIRAYQKAARNIESLTRELSDIYSQNGINGVKQVPGIGEHIAEKYEEFVKTGKVSAYEKLSREFPKDFLALVNVPGMGPKTALLLYKQLKIDSIEKLEKAARAGKLKELPGMGAKKEANILRGIALKEEHKNRFLLDEATAYAEIIVEGISKHKVAEKILTCGSLRRGQETIGDLDILVIATKPQLVMEVFTKLPIVREVFAKGETKCTIILKNGMQTDLRVIEPKSFGAAAHYFTGSKAHNIHLRQLAQQKGWKISEYGIFDRKGKRIGGRTEEEMFSIFGLQYIPPELREMRGEFESAAKGKIPKLIELTDIRGDLHMHTTATDGANSIEEMAKRAIALGYEYIAITDHTKSTRVANGLNESGLIKHVRNIRKASRNIHGIKILASAEVDILADGTLDYSDKYLKELDIVLASIHSGFKMARDKMTERIIRAFKNKYVNIFTHPTGRLIGERDPYEVDLEKVLKAAREYNVAIEINAHPKRLDLTNIFCKRAKELGVKMVISTDAHAVDQLGLMKYGVITARRGWLEKKNILNTLPYDKMLEGFKRA